MRFQAFSWQLSSIYVFILGLFRHNPDDVMGDWSAEEVYYAETKLDNSSLGRGGCPNGEDRMYGGIMWELLMFMKQARNLTYTIVAIDDAWWGGECFSSDNCTGMVGKVNRNEADIALGLYANIFLLSPVAQS